MASIAKLYLATGNAGKLREMWPLARELVGEGVTLEGRAPPLDEETGLTYSANASLKSHALFDALTQAGERRFAVLADDSGLAVDALGGAPGVRSARYAGDHVDPALHIEKLMRELGQAETRPEKRTARYHCALSLLIPDDSRGGDIEVFSEGTCEGLIGFDAHGASGFGYDPVFIVPAYQKTFGQLTEEIKNRISHRKQAFEILDRKIQASGELRRALGTI